MSIPQKEETTNHHASMEKIMSDLIQVSTSASYEELKDAQDRLQAQLQARLGEARAEGMAKIVAIVQEFGFTADEMNKALSGKVRAGKGKGKGTGAKAAPKYRDPVTGSTWTGRGVAPLWIRDVAKEDRARFLIGDAPAAAAPAVAAEAPAPVGQPVEDEPVEVMDTAPTEPTAPLFGASAE